MKILEAAYIISAPDLKHCPDFEGLPEIVLVGRSNVGKSSFINSMTWRKNLARTSNTPGKTRHINFYRIRAQESDEGPVTEFLFVDLPGYGYAKVSKSEQEHWRKNLEAYLLQRDSIRLVIQLIDSRHGPQDNDIMMFEWLQHHGRRTRVILTKSDKIGQSELAKQTKATARALDLAAPELIAFSAEKHQGRDQAWQALLPELMAPVG